MAPFDISTETDQRTLGTRIDGMDLTGPLGDDVVAELRALWMQHAVIVISDQDLTPDQHLAFARRFGSLQGHTITDILHPEYPELLVLSNRGRGGTKPINNGGAYWHSDITYEVEPPMGSILHGFIVPPADGDTLYVDMTAAYDALDPDLKAELDGVQAAHTYRHRYEMMVEAGVRPPQSEEKMAEWADVLHPVVRTHPETGRKALFVNEGFTARIDGMSDDDSRRLLNRLAQHCMEDRFIYRHQWRANDLVMWDNRCTMHCATPYDLSHERSMHRATIRGNRPV